MRGAFLIALGLLGACNREQDFSERYDAASKQIDASAKEIDAELEKREKEAGAIGNSTDPLPANVHKHGSRPANGP